MVSKLVLDSVISEFLSGKDLLAAMNKNTCGILLLNIGMPEISGLDIAARLTVLADKPLLVFVTSHDELVYDSFQFHPFGFVRKNYMEKELPRILADCVKELNSTNLPFSESGAMG